MDVGEAMRWCEGCFLGVKWRGYPCQRNHAVYGVGTAPASGGGRRLRVYAQLGIRKASLFSPPLFPPDAASVLSTGADIVATGEVVADRPPLALRTGPVRPAPGGVSVGHARVTAGTIGCVVQGPDGVQILSNNHVLANQNDVTSFDRVYQPGPVDGGLRDDYIIGSPGNYVPLQTDDWNTVDAALAIPSHPDLVQPGVLAGDQVMDIRGTATAQPGMGVWKSGRTTGVTQGVVDSVDATFLVRYRIGQLYFRGQTVIESTSAFSDGGDSGSLVLDDGNRAVGLLFAGSPQITLANRIEEVLGALGVRLVTG